MLVIIRVSDQLPKCKTSATLINKSMVMLISTGDLLVGFYLIMVAFLDTFVFSENYCEKQNDWLTDWPCILLGVVSTVGSQISLFAMSTLSLVRFHGMKKALHISQYNSRASLGFVIERIFSIVSLSVIIAIVPLTDYYSNFFVNGLLHAISLRVFIGLSDKQKHMEVLEAHYGRMRRQRQLSWKITRSMTDAMFSHDFHYPDYTKQTKVLSFYGNEGVCLFKYFVDPMDPQRKYVWLVLTINLLCFVVICACYLAIYGVSKRSADHLKGLNTNKRVGNANKLINVRLQKTQNKVTAIIATDFLTWLPFIVVCGLHYLRVVDATPWYSLFSMIALPVNSVINPLLYDDSISSPFKAIFFKVVHFCYKPKKEDLSQNHRQYVQSIRLRKRVAGDAADTLEIEQGPKERQEKAVMITSGV